MNNAGPYFSFSELQTAVIKMINPILWKKLSKFIQLVPQYVTSTPIHI